MIEFRTFLNTDPPAIVEIWGKQKPIRCLTQVLTRKMLDQMVFAKPYFDPDGLIMAFENGAPVGFVHIGFCPEDQMDRVDHSRGVVSQIRIVDCENAPQIADGLWEHAKKYLESKGSSVCHASGQFPFSPFYVGLYGGSRIQGVPFEDAETKRWLNRFGFQTGRQIEVLQLNLAGFRPPVSRAQMAIRRQYQVAAVVDPLLPNWWESCTFGWAELFGFRIHRRSDEQVFGSVMLWEIQPLSTQWGRTTMGLVDLQISDDEQREGLAMHLIGESLRHLSGHGVACVEFQVLESDSASRELAQKFGFEAVSTGHEMHFPVG